MQSQPASNDTPDKALPSNQSYEDDYGGVNGEETATSIGEQDAEEEKSLNEDYDADDISTSDVIDTNPEGSVHATPQKGLVEEGPAPDA